MGIIVKTTRRKRDISIKSISKFMDPVEPAKSLKALAKMHRWDGGQVPSPVSLRAFARRHQHGRIVRFLFYNTYLLHFNPFYSKPLIDERAQEIGEAIKRDFDIVALCEVFDGDDKRTILKAWTEYRKPFQAYGPGGEFFKIEIPSGLFSMSMQYPITRNESESFKKDGGEFQVADAHANKGILLIEVDLGFSKGKLEIYSTHTYAEANSFVRLAQITQLVEFYKKHHRAENVAMLVGDFNIDFFDNNDITFDEEYWFLVGGPSCDDFMKTNGITSTPYEHLTRLLGKIDMEDLWKRRNGTKGLTTNMVEETKKELGDVWEVLNQISVFMDQLEEELRKDIRLTDILNGLDKLRAWNSAKGVYEDLTLLLSRLIEISQELNPNIIVYNFKFEVWILKLTLLISELSPFLNIESDKTDKKICWVDNQNRLFCDDLKQGNKDWGSRYDYIFVQIPQPEHGFTLDFTRPRRACFERAQDAPGRLEMAYLSDHLGLATTLIAAEK